MLSFYEALQKGFKEPIDMESFGSHVFTHEDEHGNKYELWFERLLTGRQYYVALYKNQELLTEKVVVKPGFVKKGMGMILYGEENATDMFDLAVLLEQEKIPYVMRPHPLNVIEPGARDLLGYSPAGEWQIIIDERFSVIRGMVSFGYYEMMRTRYPAWELVWDKVRRREPRYADPERFSSAQELVDHLKGKHEREPVSTSDSEEADQHTTEQGK